MKVKRFLGVLLTSVGCITAFIGLAATVLPMIQNDQLRLVLSSFEMPSEHWVVNLMNSAMTYALRNCYQVMLAGALAAVAGAFLLLYAQSSSARKAAARNPAQAKPAAVPVPKWRPSKAGEMTERNPFANPVVGDLFIPPATKTPIHEVPTEMEMPSFAPLAQSAAKAADPVPTVAAPQRSPYQRPQVDSPAASPSARPAGDSPPAQAAPLPEEAAPIAGDSPLKAEARIISAPQAEASLGEKARAVAARVKAVNRSSAAAAPGHETPKLKPAAIPARPSAVAEASASLLAAAPSEPVAPSEPIAPAAPIAAPKPSAKPRIKSTMGKHSV